MTDFRANQTPVRNQGDRPTCVAFAVSAGHEWTAGDLAFRSVEDAMWAAHQVGGVPGREEVTVAWALGGLHAHAHSTEAAWPYGAPRWSGGRPAGAQDPANRRCLPPWSTLPDAGFISVAEALDRGSPVILTLRVVYSAWRGLGAAIDAEPGRKAPGNHAVLAVGATTAPDQIIVKNSWGPRWGARGYGFVTSRYLDHYGLCAHALEAP